MWSGFNRKHVLAERPGRLVHPESDNAGRFLVPYQLNSTGTVAWLEHSEDNEEGQQRWGAGLGVASRSAGQVRDATDYGEIRGCPTR